MSSDRLVRPQDVLRAIMQLRRQGIVPVVTDLEKLEPDLVEHMLEETTAIHGLLVKTAASAKSIREIDRRIQSLCIVLIISLRQAYQQLMQGDADAHTPPVQRPEDTD